MNSGESLYDNPVDGNNLTMNDIDEELSFRVTLFLKGKDIIGSLGQILEVFTKYNIAIDHIESRPSKSSREEYEFLVELEKRGVSSVSMAALLDDLKTSNKLIFCRDSPVPWFPRKIADLDKFAFRVLGSGELSSDHPGFTDPVYRARRAELTESALHYKHGQPIPRINYTPEELETWRVVFTRLTELLPTHACEEVNDIVPQLFKQCGYSANSIPQLEDVSLFLQECTGFRIRPVAGLLSSRDFLAGLAFRVFHSTQYVRHSSCPTYTPEPDVCHELIGHVPLFCNKEFALFSQEIGLASLGVSDEEIQQLATIYWFTVEFGICKQNGEYKAYGAALLSSFGELEYCLSDKARRVPFDPSVAAKTPYPITEYQPVYFVTESFENAKEKVRAYASSLSRPFTLRFNPYTQTVETINNRNSVMSTASALRNELDLLMDAMSKV